MHHKDEHLPQSGQAERLGWLQGLVRAKALVLLRRRGSKIWRQDGILIKLGESHCFQLSDLPTRDEGTLAAHGCSAQQWVRKMNKNSLMVGAGREAGSANWKRCVARQIMLVKRGCFVGSLFNDSTARTVFNVIRSMLKAEEITM